MRTHIRAAYRSAGQTGKGHLPDSACGFLPGWATCQPCLLASPVYVSGLSTYQTCLLISLGRIQLCALERKLQHALLVH
ncbi:MAG: hypothetical protein ACI9SE_004915, partial [Neolewinella sp.]